MTIYGVLGRKEVFREQGTTKPNPAGSKMLLLLTGLRQSLYPSTRLEAGSKKVLIGDNLSSHFSNEVLDLCGKNNINFICMPPNATHLCQPLDAAYFAPMKRQWQKILTDFKQSNRKNAGTVSKDQFPRLLKLLMKMPNQNENLIAGFRKCGIFPLDKT